MTSAAASPRELFIVGAPRCATTSLHYYLGQHPDISMAKLKEPNYYLFRRDGGGVTPLIEEPTILRRSVKSRVDYDRLFEPGACVRGDASPLYLYTQESSELIRRGAERPQIVAVLRQPAERAWSHFLYSYRGSPEDVEGDFVAAIEHELASPRYSPYRSGTHYLRLGLYAAQVSRYLDAFGEKACLFLLHEDLSDDPHDGVAGIVRFLELPPAEIDTSMRYNQSSLRRSRRAAILRGAVGAVQPYVKQVLPAAAAGSLGRLRAGTEPRGRKPELGPKLLGKLNAFFADDISALGQLLRRDLSAWTPAA